jgi:hypothetical protein
MKRESNDSEIRIGTPQTLQNATTFIKRRIFKYGPVVLGRSTASASSTPTSWPTAA